MKKSNDHVYVINLVSNAKGNPLEQLKRMFVSTIWVSNTKGSTQIQFEKWMSSRS